MNSRRMVTNLPIVVLLALAAVVGARAADDLALSPPRIYTKGTYQDYTLNQPKDAPKGAIYLVWQRHFDVGFSEVEIFRLGNDEGKYSFTADGAHNTAHIMVYFDQDYIWRVRYLDKNKKPLSDFSEDTPLKVVRDLSAQQQVNLATSNEVPTEPAPSGGDRAAGEVESLTVDDGEGAVQDAANSAASEQAAADAAAAELAKQEAVAEANAKAQAAEAARQEALSKKVNESQAAIAAEEARKEAAGKEAAAAKARQRAEAQRIAAEQAKKVAARKQEAARKATDDKASATERAAKARAEREAREQSARKAAEKAAREAEEKAKREAEKSANSETEETANREAASEIAPTPPAPPGKAKDDGLFVEEVDDSDFDY